jgi:hypothetical protein
VKCAYAYDDGAYVLGALSPAERAAYEKHLSGCASCRQAVAEIAVLPGLLGRLDRAGLEQILDPPSDTTRLSRLVTAVQVERRRMMRAQRRRVIVSSCVAASLAIVVGFGVAWVGADLVSRDGPDVPMVAMVPARTALPVTAEVGLRQTNWGTEITMRCAYTRSVNWDQAYTFRLVAHGPDGATEQVGSWVAAPGREITIAGATRFSGAELVRLELTRSDGMLLLTYDVP